jgi:hypothetical protein
MSIANTRASKQAHERLLRRGDRHARIEALDPRPAVAIHDRSGEPRDAGRADAPLVWITGHELSTLPAAFHGEAEFVASSAIGDAEADTFDRSDNLPFAREGIIAHTFAAGRLDELYHSVADEAATLDYDRMAIIVRALARGIHRVAETPAPPRWTIAGRAAGYAK